MTNLRGVGAGRQHQPCSSQRNDVDKISRRRRGGARCAADERVGGEEGGEQRGVLVPGRGHAGAAVGADRKDGAQILFAIADGGKRLCAGSALHDAGCRGRAGQGVDQDAEEKLRRHHRRRRVAGKAERETLSLS